MDDANFAPSFRRGGVKKVKGAKSILRPFFVANGRCQFCAHFPGKWAQNTFCAQAQGAGRRALFTQGLFKEASCKTQPASPPYYQFRKFFFSMKSITRIDFNNARISCRKMSIFELNSLFLLMITFAFCIHSLILQTRVLQRSKTKKNVISYKNKFLKWLSDNCA